MNTLLISGFADEISSDFSKQIQVLNKLGIGYMSIRGVDGKNIGDYTLEEIEQSIVPRLEAGKIKISSIGSPIGKIDVDDEEAFQQQKRMLETLCQACKLFECDYIRVFSFFISEDKNPDDFKAVVIRKMQEFVAIAKEYGLILLHENEKDIYGDIGRRCKTLIDTINSPNFKGIFDFANFVQCQEDTRACYELLKDDTIYIHIKDAVYIDGDNVLCGTGDGKIQELLTDFIADGYEGFLTLEPHLVLFDSLKDLENKEATEVIKSNKAISAEEAFGMQYRALQDILKTIQGDV